MLSLSPQMNHKTASLVALAEATSSRTMLSFLTPDPAEACVEG